MKKEIIKEIMFNRRSIRKFKDVSIEEEDIKTLLQFAMSGPSACFRMPWDFYVVLNEEVLEKLRHVTRFSNMNAKCAIIVCGNLDKALPGEMSNFWIQDCSAAIENILLGAEALDLGACWIGIYPQERCVNRMKNILNIESERIVPLGMVYVGYKAEEKEPKCYYDEKNVHYLK